MLALRIGQSAKGMLDSRNYPSLRTWTTLFAVVATALMLGAGSAQAASLQLPASVDVTVEQGGSAPFSIPVTAGGAITCDWTAVVAIDSLYSVNAAGDVATGDPADVTFQGADRKGNGGNCDVTWSGAPDPYQLPATATAAAATPLGDYESRIGYEVTNTGGSGPSGKLGSAGTAVVIVHVVPATPPPLVVQQIPAAEPPVVEQLVLGVRAAPRPVFGKSVMLGLVKGTVRYRKSGGAKASTLTGSVIVPNGTVVDAGDGVVKVTVEHSPGGVLDSADAWGGAFKVVQDSKGITNMTLTGKISAAKKASAARAVKVVAKRRLWVNAKGNFKTRGKRASAITRGTYWLTEETAGGTAVNVKRGAVAVRDFGLRRTTLVRAGHSYLARKPAKLSSPRFTG